MVQSTKPPANGFVRIMRRIYNPLGFSKGYNAALWFITLGYLFGFTLARSMYFSFYGVFCNPKVFGVNGAVPGECYYYLRNPYKTGIQIHLYTILPAAMLVCLQFTPWFRHHVMIFHRINGYLIILLSTISSAGALVVANIAFGGSLATRSYVGVLVVITTLSYVFAYVNIKLLQIDQHRAWMIRAWSYFATIITLRLIMFTAACIIGDMHDWYTTRPCGEINFVLGQKGTLKLYPECQSYYTGNKDQRAIVLGNYKSPRDPVQSAAGVGIAFGPSGWLALWLHVIAVEFYLHLTPAENERLRQVSYERQLQRGSVRPGYAGLVAERFGDANPFVPQQKKTSVDTTAEVESDGSRGLVKDEENVRD